MLYFETISHLYMNQYFLVEIARIIGCKFKNFLRYDVYASIA